MKQPGKVMIDHIHNLCLKREFKEAYEYSMENEFVGDEFQTDITCFRYLLACINGKEYYPPEFSFEDTPRQQPVGRERIAYRMDIMCQGKTFNELRELCKKYTE